MNDTGKVGDHPAEGGLDRAIMRLALPAIVTNVTVPLLALCDTAVCGHLGETRALGAIAVGGMMINVAYWLFGFLRMGTTGLGATAYGAGDSRGMGLVFWRSLLLGLLLGGALMVCRGPLCGMLLEVAGATPDVSDMAARYYSICICGAPALLGTMAVTGWMIGMQSTVLPMLVAVAGNIVNIGLSLWFVFGLGLGFPGVAWGTLGAQWFGLMLALALALRMRGGTVWPGWIAIVSGEGLARYFSVNSNLFFRSMCIMAVSMAVTSVGARLGTVTLAANAVMMQFFIFFSYCMDGFAFAGEALTGRYAGAGEMPMVRRSVRRLLLWSLAMAVGFLLVYAVGWDMIASLITDRAEVQAEVVRYRWAVLLIPPLSVGAFIYDGFYIGLTETAMLLRATLAAAALFFIVLGISAWSSGTGLPVNGMLWTAFLGYLLVRGAVLSVALPRTLSVRCIKGIKDKS